MAARTLQPSEYEIQREVEALRDIRRRSSNPGALTIDPDLPNQSPPPSPTSNYWSPKSKSPGSSDGAGVATSPAVTSSSYSPDDVNSDEPINPNNPADDPFHLFWVPASVHPEIAPAEFKAFLQEHARNPPSADGHDVSFERVPSFSSRASLSRKRSMLSRQYQPKEGDDIEDEKIVPLRRNRSFAQNQVPQLTISDLQRLEELAEEASESDDPSKLRSVLRRSLSLNLSPTAIEKMDAMPDLGDEADVPIIVPPPGQILRRAARTKIRKPGLPGDGAGHRFGASRRIRRNSAEGRSSADHSSNENSELESPSRRQTLSDDGLPNQRPDSFSEEASIFDAYVRDEDEDVVPAVVPVPETTPSPPHEDVAQPQPEIQPSLLEALGPILQQPVQQPQPLPAPEPSEELSSRTPSPPNEPIQETPSPSITYPSSPQPSNQVQQQISQGPPHIFAPIPQQPARKEKEKDKKGLFGKWGSDKGGKKGKGGVADQKDKEGFFGSLFGGKKKQDEYAAPVTSSTGRETAQALLGASKSSKNQVAPPSSPGLAPGPSNFARYPIHVERAIYRLSHIKLANPRRPLYEQVLISNLMFWYLGVINKAQASNSPSSESSASQAEKEEKEKEQKEKEMKEKAEKERLEKEQKERELEMKKRESGKRGSLTKTPAGGPVGRRAETPVKGPQYDIQQQVMQKEYNGFNGQGPPNRPPPQMNGGNGQPYNRPPKSPQNAQFSQQQQQQYHPQHQSPGPGQPYPSQHPSQPQPYPPQGQPYPPQGPQPYPPSQGQQYPNAGPRIVPQQQPQMRQGPPEHYYYQSHENSPPRGGLPPGAMAPMGGPSGHMGPPQHMQQPMNYNQPPRNPPPNNFQPPPQGRGGPYPMSPGPENVPPSPGSPRGPMRSLSANAVPPSHQPPMNGTLRKGNSAHAVAPYDPNRRPRTGEGKRGPSEEEDMPLAVYQQQQRK